MRVLLLRSIQARDYAIKPLDHSFTDIAPESIRGITDHFGSLWVITVTTDHYASIQIITGHYLSFRVNMDHFGSMRIITGHYGSLRVITDHYEFFAVRIG